MRNDIIHDKGKASIEGSVAFLISYAESLSLGGHQEVIEDNGKGIWKAGLPVEPGNLTPDGRERKMVEAVKWNPPLHGWVKVNVDAGFCKDTGLVGCGVVARDENGETLLLAFIFIPSRPSL
jgi:hypothetical protein